MGEIEGVWDEQCDSMSVIQESMCDERYKEQFNYVGSSSSPAFFPLAGSLITKTAMPSPCIHTRMGVFLWDHWLLVCGWKLLSRCWSWASASSCNASWVTFSQGSSLCWDLNLTTIIITAVMLLCPIKRIFLFLISFDSLTSMSTVFVLLHT